MALAAGGVGLAAWVTRAARSVPEAMGAQIVGDRAERVAASPEWSDGKFRNGGQQASSALPVRSIAGSLVELVRTRHRRYPANEVPLVTDPVDARAEGLHVTWFGHSSALIQLDGAVVLLDPVWSQRCSPTQAVGPRRIHPVPHELVDLPAIDAVVISHDHYDHLDIDTIKEIARLAPSARFVVPLGVGAHLERWGVAPGRIDELDWHEDTKVAGVRLVATPAQHFSGRGFSRDGTLWASWVLEGPGGKVFYSGDTGYVAEFAQIGAQYGPFDIALVQVGAYDDSWQTVHMLPEQGVQTALDVGAKAMLPVHWGTFSLAFHPWSEPVERVLVEAQRQGVQVLVPRPGERVTIGADRPDPSPWWRVVG